MSVKKQPWETAKSRDEAWAWNIPHGRDPVSGKILPQEGDARPVGTEKTKTGDVK